MEAPSSGSNGPRAGSAAASGGPRAGSGASGAHALLALEDPEVARFLELEPKERSVEFHMIMTDLVTEVEEYQITSAAWLEHIEEHSFTTELRTDIDIFIVEVTETVSRIEDIKADPKKDLAMHLVEEDTAVQALQEKWGALRQVALRFKKKDIDNADDVEHLFETPRKSKRQKRG